MYRLIAWVVTMSWTLVSHAQLQGRVVEVADTDTTGVPGALLSWTGTTIAATSDGSGMFSIPFAEGQRELNVHALGYNEKKLRIRDTANAILIVLSSKGLEEVEVVYYSSGTEIAMLSAIKAETLNERSLMKAACCNLSESFETNPSIDVNFADAVTGTKQIQMLGLSGQYAQITKENMPYLRGLANNYGLTFIPGTWIKSIQLSKGAGSVINGYESFTGQINTELQAPFDMERLQVNAYVNENGRNEYNVNAKIPVSKKLNGALLGHYSQNPLAQDRNGDGFADIPTGQQINFINKYQYQGSNGFEAQFGGGYLRDNRIGGQFKLLNPGQDSLPLYKIGISNEKWEVFSKTGKVFRRKPGTSMGLQLSYLDHNQHDYLGLNGYNGREKTLYANFIYQGIIKTTSHTYKTGASYMDDDVSEMFNGSYYHRREQVPGAFFEYSYNRGEKLNIVAGLRGDYHNYYGFFATPRLHVRYAFTPKSVLRFSGGHALRTANIFGDYLYLMASSRQWSVLSSNTNMPYGLNPERAWNYGLNYTYKFKFNYRDAYVTFDGYRTDFTNQVIVDVYADPHQVKIYNLNGRSYSNTLQAEISIEARKRLFLKAAYRFVDTWMQFESGLRQKPLQSRHRAFLNGSYETRNRHWQFDGTVQYNGSKQLPSTTSSPEAYARPRSSPAFFNVLGQITWMTKMNKDEFHVYIGVENLLDYKQTNVIIAPQDPFGKYFDASVIWGPVYGRMLYAGLRLKIH